MVRLPCAGVLKPGASAHVAGACGWQAGPGAWLGWEYHMPGPHIFLRILLWARWRLHCPQSIVLLLTSWSWSLLTSVSPSPKVGQWMRSVVFQPVFQKNVFLHTPLGNMKRQPLQQTGRAGCHLPRPHSRPVQAPGKEGQEPWRRCGVSALPPFCQPRQGFLSR